MSRLLILSHSSIEAEDSHMGGLVKMFEKDVIGRRLENRARVVNEYQPMQSNSASPEKHQPTLCHISFEERARLLEFIDQINKKCRERMAREKVLVYKLEQMADGVLVAYSLDWMTKADADKNIRAGVAGGELLDLDPVYIGILYRKYYLFLSENALTRSIDEFGPDVDLMTLVPWLYEQRQAAYEAAYRSAA